MNYTRKYFIKDILNPNNFLKNAGTLEFDSFEDFYHIMKEKELHLETLNRLIIPASNAFEVKALLHVPKNKISPIVIYLKDFSKETLQAFYYNNESADKNILIDAENTSLLSENLKKYATEESVAFFRNTFGFFKVKISYKDIQNIIFKITDPYFSFPFLCSGIIDWDWESFNKCTIEELTALRVTLNFVNDNLYRRKVEYNWQNYIQDTQKVSIYHLSFDWLDYSNEYPLKIYIKDHCMYVDDPSFTVSKFDFSKKRNAEEEDEEKIDHILSFYEGNPEMINIKNFSLISISQNWKITGDANMVPEIVRIVDNMI